MAGLFGGGSSSGGGLFGASSGATRKPLTLKPITLSKRKKDPLSAAEQAKAHGIHLLSDVGDLAHEALGGGRKALGAALEGLTIPQHLISATFDPKHNQSLTDWASQWNNKKETPAHLLGLSDQKGLGGKVAAFTADAAVDPLNLVGVGEVKTAAKLAGAAGEGAKAGTFTSMFGKRLKDINAGHMADAGAAEHLTAHLDDAAVKAADARLAADAAHAAVDAKKAHLSTISKAGTKALRAYHGEAKKALTAARRDVPPELAQIPAKPAIRDLRDGLQRFHTNELNSLRESASTAEKAAKDAEERAASVTDAARATAGDFDKALTAAAKQGAAKATPATRRLALTVGGRVLAVSPEVKAHALDRGLTALGGAGKAGHLAEKALRSDFNPIKFTHDMGSQLFNSSHMQDIGARTIFRGALAHADLRTQQQVAAMRAATRSLTDTDHAALRDFAQATQGKDAGDKLVFGKATSVADPAVQKTWDQMTPAARDAARYFREHYKQTRDIARSMGILGKASDVPGYFPMYEKVDGGLGHVTDTAAISEPSFAKKRVTDAGHMTEDWHAHEAFMAHTTQLNRAIAQRAAVDHLVVRYGSKVPREGLVPLDKSLTSRAWLKDNPIAEEAAKRYVPKDVAEAINQTQKIYSEPEYAQKFLGVMRGARIAFVRTAYGLNPGSAITDFVGDVYNIWLVAGEKTAAKMFHPRIAGMAHDVAAYSEWPENPALQAVAQAHGVEHFGQVPVAKFGGRTYTADDLMMDANAGGVLNRDFANVDGLRPGALSKSAGLNDLTRARLARKGLMPAPEAPTGGLLTRARRAPGAYANTLGDAAGRRANTTKLAAMIAMVEDGAKRGLGHDEATSEAIGKVIKATFDYGDLSPFEQRVLKNFAPFYTFTRKNVPLQLANMIRNPGRSTAYWRGQAAIADTSPDSGLNGDFTSDMLFLGKDSGHSKFLNLKLPVTSMAFGQDTDGTLIKGGDFAQLVNPVYKLGAETVLNGGTPIDKTQSKQGLKERAFRAVGGQVAGNLIGSSGLVRGAVGAKDPKKSTGMKLDGWGGMLLGPRRVQVDLKKAQAGVQPRINQRNQRLINDAQSSGAMPTAEELQALRDQRTARNKSAASMKVTAAPKVRKRAGGLFG